MVESAAGPAAARVSPGFLCRCKGAGEGAEMMRTITGHPEVAREAGFADHGGGVAADQHRFAGHEEVVIVKGEAVPHPGDGAEVCRRLAVVLADVLKSSQFEGAHGHGVE